MRHICSNARKLVVVALACVVLSSSAQRPLAYQQRSNRSEGLQSDFNAKPPFEVRGIFAWREAMLDTNANLKISFYLPPHSEVKDIHAQELHKLKNYLMTPNLPLPGEKPEQWVTFSPWPASEVLTKVGLSPDSLGIVISLKLPNVTNTFAPAIFYSDHAPSTISTYTLFFVSDRPVERVRCIVTDHLGRKYECTLPKGEKSIASGVTIPFNIAAAEMPDGLATVIISGDYADDETGDSLHAILHLYHQRRVFR